MRYPQHLARVLQVTDSLYQKGKGITVLQKPEKLYLDNTNLAWTFAPQLPDPANLRETFFYNQVRQKHLVQYSPKGDFLIDGEAVIEVGRKNKKAEQMKELPNYYLAADDIGVGVGRQVPL